jgi:hypothetical protein
MSGEKTSENQYITDKIDKLNEQIDALKKQYGLLSIVFDEKIEDIINFSWNEIEKLTPSECLQYSYMLNQYALCLTSKINGFKSVKRFCLNALNLVISSNYKNFKVDYSAGDVTKYLIIKNDAYAKVLNEKILELEINIETLESLIPIINNINNTYKSMSYIKREPDNEYN